MNAALTVSEVFWGVSECFSLMCSWLPSRFCPVLFFSYVDLSSLPQTLQQILLFFFFIHYSQS